MSFPVPVDEPESSVEKIERIFAAHAEAIDGVASAFDHEPEVLGSRPCVTMLYVRIQQDDEETGPATENTWAWRVNVYVDLGGSNDYRKAQRDLKRLVPRVLKIVRDDSRMDGLADFSSIVDEDGEPTFDHDAGLLWKSLRLQVRLEEI